MRNKNLRISVISICLIIILFQIFYYIDLKDTRPINSPTAEGLNDDERVLKIKRMYLNRVGAPKIKNSTHNSAILEDPVVKEPDEIIYIPEERVVHFDLKGAPLLPSVYSHLIPWLAKNGATSILLEYEDMFPWEQSLQPMAATNHYTKADIANIIQVCKQNNVNIIPLIQTFGHLEFVLKLKEFAHLREVSDTPQTICPSHNATANFIQTMIDQIMALHTDIKYLHIGCDEVLQMGKCEICRLKSRASFFLSHVASTARYIVDKYKVTPILWHDMITKFSLSNLKQHNIIELVEPMVWVYAEDVYHFANINTWKLIENYFPNVWTASAYKGAFGEHLDKTNIKRHLTNNINWLKVMKNESPKLKGKMRGIVLTGWQRYDHFAILCELLPSAIPSLIINLLTVTHGIYNENVELKALKSLNCPNPRPLNLDNDPSSIDRLSACRFPGVKFFKTLPSIQYAKEEVEQYLEKYTLSRGWLTDYNMRHLYSSKLRINEDLPEIHNIHSTIIRSMKHVKTALTEWYDEFTIEEWLEQHYWTNFKRLDKIINKSNSILNMKYWGKRPISNLEDIKNVIK